MQQAGLSLEQAAATLARDVTRQGMFIGANELFLACSVLFLMVTALVWLSKPVKPQAGQAAPVDAGH